MAIQFSFFFFGGVYGGDGGPLDGLSFFSCFFLFLLHTRSLGLVMNRDGPVLPSAVGPQHRGPMTEPCSSPPAPPLPSLARSLGANTSLDRRVSVQEMGRELVDMWTAAASRVDMCLDTRGGFFFTFYFFI